MEHAQGEVNETLFYRRFLHQKERSRSSQSRLKVAQKCNHTHFTSQNMTFIIEELPVKASSGAAHDVCR